MQDCQHDVRDATTLCLLCSESVIVRILVQYAYEFNTKLWKRLAEHCIKSI